MLVPSVLAKVLVIVAFQWNLKKLNFLRMAMHEVVQYRLYTDVDVVIVTNENTSVANALHNFGFDGISIWPFNSTSNQYTGHKYDMLWEHRNVVTQAYQDPTKHYTTFLYIEDDTLFPWPQLVSWAIDSEMLEPLNFTRGIFRTEINALGHRSMNDMIVDLDNKLGCHMNLTFNATNLHYVRSVDLETYSGESKQLLKRTQQKYQKSSCPKATMGMSSIPPYASSDKRGVLKSQWEDSQKCPVHRYYVQLFNPFQGLWITTRSYLERLMQHRLWDKATSLRHETRRPRVRSWTWGYPERSNGILLFADPPAGFLTTNVVPYDILSPSSTSSTENKKPVLSPYARIEHVRNGYSVHCVAEDALTF